MLSYVKKIYNSSAITLEYIRKKCMSTKMQNWEKHYVFSTFETFYVLEWTKK